MGSIGRRLERLEADKRRGAAGLSRETLGRMSDEDLDALEEALEVRQESGAATFEDLYRAVTERSRRTLDALLGVHEALSRGEEPWSVCGA